MGSFSDWLSMYDLVPDMRWSGGGGWCTENPPGLQITQLVLEVLRGIRLYSNFYSDNLIS